MADRYAQITIDRQAAALDRPFTYRIPPRLAAAVELGSYVLVPFGRQPLCGFVTGFGDSPGDLEPEQIRDVEAVLGEMAFFDQALLAVAQRMADYYRCHLIDVLRCALPEGLTQKVERVVSWSGNEDLDKAVTKRCSRSRPRSLRTNWPTCGSRRPSRRASWKC